MTIAVTLLVAAAGYGCFLGYFGGPVYRLIPARTAATFAFDRGTIAVYFSGDLGFNTGMGPGIARGIARQGIPVLGFNSLTVFAKQRTAPETAVIVEQAVKRALAMPGTRRVVLIGQSFGANIMIEGAGALPPSQKRQVVLIAALTPGDTTYFQTAPGGIVNLGHKTAALPAARMLNWAPAICVQGADESHSLCPEWLQPNVRRIALPGDHFLDDDSALVARTLVQAISKENRTFKDRARRSLPNVEAP